MLRVFQSISSLVPVWIVALSMGATDPPEGNASPATAQTAELERGSKHWAFQPLRPVEPPVSQSEVGTRTARVWSRTPVDRFILAKLDEKGLVPNPLADRRTLIRRAYFDLVGLPPAPEEVEAFVKDPDPDAYSKLIDRLLENPQFGERWARHWLDVARFAESHGYEQDYDRPNAYHYRDFVIRAFNQDLPYDTFVKWQIAGDEFEPENPLAMMATGFLAAGTHATQITANQAEKERYDELDDMVRTIGTTMLGLTLGCARCHDHKYDPVPTHDYYRLISTFATTVRSDLDVDFDPQWYKEAKARFDREHGPLLAAVEKFEREELPGRFEQWLKGRESKADDYKWIVLDPVESKSEGGATFTKLADGSLLVSDKNSDHDTYTFVVRTQLKGITAVRLETLAHESLVKGGPGRAPNGNFGLTDFRVTAAPLNPSPQPLSPEGRGASDSPLSAGGRGAGGEGAAADAAQPITVNLLNPKATFEQTGLPVSNAIDDKKDSCWAVDPQFGKDHAAVFEIESQVGFEGGTVLTFTLEFKCNKQHGIGRPRLSVTTAPRPVALDGQWIPEPAYSALTKLLANPETKLADDARSALLKWYRTLEPDWRKLDDHVQQHAKNAPKPKLAKVLVSSEGVPAVRLHTQGLDFYDPVYFLKRGDPNQKGEVATQSFLQTLMRAPDGEKHWLESSPTGWRTSYRRRSLSNWLTDVQHGAGHLLARVIVNRLWYLHMGRGIVATPSDFGTKGEPPTHPELLDWLATELVRNGWRLKPIHKLIMTSAVYAQSTAWDEQRAALDRENILYWRRPHRRLEAEVIRDAMLAASGTLDTTLFGPGTLDPKHRRRSIYFFVKRSQLVPMMTVFDAPDSLQDLPCRSTTTVTPQALMLMNSATIREYAANCARRIKPQADRSMTDAVHAGYAVALGRPPRTDELADSTAFLEQQVDSYKADGKADAIDLALTDFCQALMNLNEFVYVE